MCKAKTRGIFESVPQGAVETYMGTPDDACTKKGLCREEKTGNKTQDSANI